MSEAFDFYRFGFAAREKRKIERVCCCFEAHSVDVHKDGSEHVKQVGNVGDKGYDCKE